MRPPVLDRISRVHGPNYRALVLLSIAFALGQVACGETSRCGKGTIAVDGKCVLPGDVLGCGEGTALDGGVCYPVTQDVTETDTTGTTEDGQTTLDTAVDTSGQELPCAPNCIGRNCGEDGCGGSCGTCGTAEAPVCQTALGVCVATCVPNCLGKNCGDDGCGGTCGSCDGGLLCKKTGRCVPKEWTCKDAYYAASDACDCACGAADPDCDDSSAYIAGCGSLQKCGPKGTCVDKVPAAWTCPVTTYDALDGCHCGCGAPDPDCAIADVAIIGCGQGESCSATGTCGKCVPACTGKTCGADGCGGSCGSCKSGTACDAGKCVDPCSPKPLVCINNTCGDNGCGGSCGTCPDWATCNNGGCEAIPLPEAPTSCVNKCGGIATSGCACTSTCKANGTCCQDYAAVCSCAPDCKGKQCGSDGCGGTCGSCKSGTPYCSDTQQCVATCTKKCDGKQCGSDGCGGTCGSCSKGKTCAWTGQCVPATWDCPIAYYGDGQACDCGCGVSDPDCDKKGTLTFGCPTSSTQCTKGLCDIAFCDQNADCKGGWCTGVYAAGASALKGVCGKANPKGKAPGQPCTDSTECASSVCVGGLCRTYCQLDADCPQTQRCIGISVTTPLTGKSVGHAGVCHTIAGSGTGCTSQKSCATSGQVCTAFVDPTSFGARMLCANGISGGGSSCAAGACPKGQLCGVTAKGAICGLACPGGDTDCGASATCGSATLHDNGTADPSDDPKVALCVPK